MPRDGRAPDGSGFRSPPPFDQASRRARAAPPTGHHTAPSRPYRLTTLKKLLLLALVAAGFTGACALLYKSPVTYDPYTTGGGVLVQDLVIPVQDDLPFILGTERVRFHMVGLVLGEDGAPGAEFENTYERGEPLEVDLSADPLPQGLLEGLVNMRVLGRRQLTVPPELAFGSAGIPDRGVPPDATVRFEVELMERISQ